MLVKRDAALVQGEPLIERLQRGVKSSGEVYVARAADHVLEVVQELVHVADLFGAWDTAAAVDVGRHIVVAHLLTQPPGECVGHLSAGQVLASDADSFTDVLAAQLEDAVGALADVLGGDPGELLVAYGQRDRQLAPGPFGGPCRRR